MFAIGLFAFIWQVQNESTCLKPAKTRVSARGKDTDR